MEAGLLTKHSQTPVEWIRSTPILVIGLLAVIVPVMIHVGQESWSTEQGAHGPIVLATGLWLLSREWGAARAIARPGSWLVGGVLLAVLLPLYLFARVTSIVEIEGATMYAIVLTTAYLLWGAATIRVVWFPLFYLAFMFPPPDTLFAMLTQPLKIAISQWAVGILHAAGYPIAGSGVSIQIGQYDMLVAAACAGLNSMISLTALGMFYIYIRHSANWRYMLFLVACILPVAIVANLVRVIILLLVTYHFGEAAGQGFIHEAAGLTMFMSALLGIFLIDSLAAPIRDRLAARGAA
ncbi:exosortase V [Sphingomonas sp. TX0543]|uniref:exosortase V n=1 Tax=Sphingomonas sp. TX0543 TaxID=3399682 RepID=UPI003AFB58F2